VGLTRSRFKVISSTKCEVKITKKYRVASCVIVPRIVGTLIPGTFDRIAKYTVNANANASKVQTVSAG
jgi:hypothetical protein